MQRRKCGCEAVAEAPREATAPACYGPGVRAIACYLAVFQLGFFSDVVRDLLKEAPAVHFDETRSRVTGRLHWVHVASTALVRHIECHERRGTVAMEEMGVIEKMTGVLVHDGWKPYRAYDVVHALCNAHSAKRAVMRNSA